MCINYYEYAKGPSRIIPMSPSEQPFDSWAQDIDPGATGVQTYTANNPQDDPFAYLFDQGIIQGISQDKTSSTKDQIQTFTTTIFTPGIDNTRQALEIKGVADNLLGATGAVLGGTGALLSNPGAFALGVSSGDQAGRNVGAVMWDILDSTWWRGGSLAGNYNKGQDYGPKGWRSYSGL